MTNSELRADIHSIATIPDADRDSTGPQQMWIWAGANIAPVNWALGALGIIAFFAALSAGWSVEDGLVGALQGPISLNLLGGADLSWLVGIVVSGGLYLALGKRATSPSVVASGASR